MWRDSLDGEWRCSLQDTVSCQTRIFTDLLALVAYLQAGESQPPPLAPNPRLSKWIRMDLRPYPHHVGEEDQDAL
jgi:hypothetical protein